MGRDGAGCRGRLAGLPTMLSAPPGLMPTLLIQDTRRTPNPRGMPAWADVRGRRTRPEECVDRSEVCIM